MLLLLCSKYLALGAKLPGCGALELGEGGFGWNLIVLPGAWVSDGSVWGREVSWTVGGSIAVPAVQVGGPLSVLPFVSDAGAIDVC